MLKTSALAIFSVMLATAAQILLRAGMERVGYIGAGRLGSPVKLALQVARTPQVLMGLGLFGLSAVTWLIVLSRVPLSFAYPFAGLVYVLTTVFARFVLKEPVPSLRWFGIALIIIGIITVGATSPPEVKQRRAGSFISPSD